MTTVWRLMLVRRLETGESLCRWMPTNVPQVRFESTIPGYPLELFSQAIHCVIWDSVCICVVRWMISSDVFFIVCPFNFLQCLCVYPHYWVSCFCLQKLKSKHQRSSSSLSAHRPPMGKKPGTSDVRPLMAVGPESSSVSTHPTALAPCCQLRLDQRSV